MKSPLRHKNLPHLLLQSREALMRRFRPVLNQYGVTEQQWRILRVLLDEDGLEPRQLCERCLISSPSIAGVLPAAIICCKVKVIEMVGEGEIYGWEEETNPTSVVAGPTHGAHD